MRIFVTGASGFIGMPLLELLQAAGHEVSALVRSQESASRVARYGARVIKGDLTDIEVLRTSAAEAEGIVHLGFVYDFANLQKSVQIDFEAIRAMLSGMEGPGRFFVGTNGTLGIQATAGCMATEDTPLAEPFALRGPAELLVRKARSVRGMVVSLAPTVHGSGDHSFIPELIQQARLNGLSLYPGDGSNTWQAVYRQDAARLFLKVIENGAPGRRYHGVAESAIPMRDIAIAIAQELGIQTDSVSPEEAVHRMGWIGHVAALGGPVSSRLTQQELGWTPVGPTLIEDMHPSYFSQISS